MSKSKIAGIATGVVLLVGILTWMFTAPYLSNQGIGRVPGVILGGTATSALDDFSPLNGAIQGPLLMKQTGFPPFVNHLSWVGTPEGVITATRPDGGLWAKRVRERGGDGWLRIGDSTYMMEAVEKFGDERLAMMEKWAAKTGRTLDEPLYEGSEPLRDWEVFFWVPRS
ncbi:MAG: hypothetical protein COA96_02950 [SAR86 cluster bacterium]|uniref:Uncharacterized protein n=1 Tax=SAR86 cluster bacterium TaxID=2030880 RepID=A0A2A5B7J1_9GAMM|nr:MAG: hypothetical protein COA96_02950 [SAR86 cluster bacterium]